MITMDYSYLEIKKQGKKAKPDAHLVILAYP